MVALAAATASGTAAAGADGAAAKVEALAKHDADGKPPIDHILVNVGRTGLNTEGDSRILLPRQSLFATVTAPAGTTLNYVCAIHPWMQAKIHVT